MKKPEIFDIRLAASLKIAPHVRELIFERSDGATFDFDPGQWVNLVLPLPSGEVRRAYSIASPPDGTSRFEIAVTRVENGPGSNFLHDLPIGSKLSAIGPHGFFTRVPDDPSPSLFIGTGTGVTPLRSMLLAALARSATSPLWLLFGARYEDDILYRDEIAKLASLHPNVRYVITLSRPGSSWRGHSGYVQGHVPELLRELAEVSSAAPHVFVCGLERMVKTVRELCRNELNVDRKRVHTERYD